MPTRDKYKIREVGNLITASPSPILENIFYRSETEIPQYQTLQACLIKAPLLDRIVTYH